MATQRSAAAVGALVESNNLSFLFLLRKRPRTSCFLAVCEKAYACSARRWLMWPRECAAQISICRRIWPSRLPTSCSQSMTEHNRDSKAGLYPGYVTPLTGNFGSRIPYQHSQDFLRTALHSKTSYLTFLLPLPSTHVRPASRSDALPTTSSFLIIFPPRSCPCNSWGLSPSRPRLLGRPELIQKLLLLCVKLSSELSENHRENTVLLYGSYSALHQILLVPPLLGTLVRLLPWIELL